MRIKQYQIILLFFAFVVLFPVTNISAQVEPNWFKNVVLWHEHGLISDKEYYTCIYYLEEKGVLIP